MKTITLLSLAAAITSATAEMTIFKRSADPSPTKAPEVDNVISTCTEFFTARDGDHCRSIVALHRGKFTFEQFVEWNPMVGDNCANGLIAGVPYCISVTGDNSTNNPNPLKTQTELSESKPTATTTKSASASPNQTAVTGGSPASNSCGTFYQAKRGDTCYSVVAAHKTFTFDEFIAANPSVGDHCYNGLFEGGWYLVGDDTVDPEAPSTGFRKIRRSA